jgi:hypothetical protein
MLFLPIFLLKARYGDRKGGRSLAVLTLKVDNNLFEVGHACYIGSGCDIFEYTVILNV